MIRFKIDETKVLPKYIFAYTQTELYKKWVKAIQRTTGQPNINAEEYRSLEIPLPDKKIQEKVIETYFDFIFQKQTNEAEAEKLLASIDDYLLNELGITLPTPTENTLKNRMFIRTFKQIQNKRVDPFFHQDKFINNLEIIEKGKYPVKQLKEIISGGLIKGSLPKQDEKDGECSVVQINSINNDGTISLDDLLTAKPIFSNSQKLSENDVLVVITGATIGKIAFWNYEGEYFLGGDIVKFQTNEFAENSFVYNYLRSCLMQTEIKRNVTGATNGHLAPSDVANLPIPVPPLDKQKEIADHITEIRNQAQALKDKTKGLLKKASEEIEEILLN
jgi:restriction endonuclease S subunit